MFVAWDVGLVCRGCIHCPPAYTTSFPLRGCGCLPSSARRRAAVRDLVGRSSQVVEKTALCELVRWHNSQAKRGGKVDAGERGAYLTMRCPSPTCCRTIDQPLHPSVAGGCRKPVLAMVPH